MVESVLEEVYFFLNFIIMVGEVLVIVSVGVVYKSLKSIHVYCLLPLYII